MRLIIGLGNPGPKYRNTRHNLGYDCVDLIAEKWRICNMERRAKAALRRGRWAGQELVLAKPRTFMNSSGEAVSYLLDRFTVDLADLLVIYDDMQLPLGRLRVRPKGSDGGHKGIRSIINALRTDNIPRVRLGIGCLPEGEDPVDYVLGRFSQEDSLVLNRALESAVDAAECWLEEGIDAAMNRFN